MKKKIIKISLFVLLVIMNNNRLADDPWWKYTPEKSLGAIVVGVIGFVGYAAYDQYYYDNVATTQERLDRLRCYAADPETEFKEYYQKKILKLEEKLKQEQEEKKQKEEIERASNGELGESLQQKLDFNKNLYNKKKSFFFPNFFPNFSKNSLNQNYSHGVVQPFCIIYKYNFLNNTEVNHPIKDLLHRCLKYVFSKNKKEEQATYNRFEYWL